MLRLVEEAFSEEKGDLGKYVDYQLTSHSQSLWGKTEQELEGEREQ